MTTVYDVTTWSVPGNPTATPCNDIGLIINSIIADIKRQQTSQASKPGAVIYAPGSDLPQTRPPFRTLNSSRPTGSVRSWVLPPRLRTTPLAVSSSGRQLYPGHRKGNAPNGPAWSPPAYRRLGMPPSLHGVQGEPG